MTAPVTMELRLKRPSKVYHLGELVCGVVVLTARSDLRHDGLTLSVNGSVELTLTGKSAGVVDAFYATPKSFKLLQETLPLSAAGKLAAGVTQVPFEVTLSARHSRPLYETYHGLYASVQYTVTCELRRGVLAKDVCAQIEFMVEAARGSAPAASQRPLLFLMQPGPDQPYRRQFRLRGRIETTECAVTEPLRGHLILEQCDAVVRSLELQLVRTEACGRTEALSRQSSEVQNIQVGLGDVPRGLAIPIHMVFPRLFTCASVSASHFQIDFSINVVIVFEGDDVVSENFPLKLTRY